MTAIAEVGGVWSIESGTYANSSEQPPAAAWSMAVEHTYTNHPGMSNNDHWTTEHSKASTYMVLLEVRRPPQPCQNGNVRFSQVRMMPRTAGLLAA